MTTRGQYLEFCCAATLAFAIAAALVTLPLGLVMLASPRMYPSVTQGIRPYALRQQPPGESAIIIWIVVL